MKKWLLLSIARVWDGLLNHLGTVIAMLLVSFAGILLMKVRIAVRSIPIELTIIAFLLLVLMLVFAIRRIMKQSSIINGFKKKEEYSDNFRYISHFGAFWKLYVTDNYIEDFPYCTCCEPKQILSIIEWHPIEKYKCPKTGNILSLFDSFYIDKHRALESLRSSYATHYTIADIFYREYNRFKELNPTMSEKELLIIVFKNQPFIRIPKKEKESILKRFNESRDIARFFVKNHDKYTSFISNKNE